MEQRGGDVVGMEVYDILHSLNTRKRNAVDQTIQTASTAEKQNLTSTTRSIDISISDLLKIVNETHQSLLSEDVLAHFNEECNPQGYYTGRVKFSLRETDENVQSELSTLGEALMLTRGHRITEAEADRIAAKALQDSGSTWIDVNKEDK